VRVVAWSLLVYLAFGIIAVGGDHFAVYRFGAHLLPGLFLVFAVLVSTIENNRFRYASVTLVLVASACFLPDIADHRKHVRDVQKWTYMGQYMKERFPQNWSVATLAIGAIGYYSELQILDMYGIVDSHIAHRVIRTGGGYAGHEKHDNAYILNRRPDVILLDNQFHQKPGKLLLWGEAAPEMEKHPEFKRSYVYKPVLTNSGYINLFIRKDLVRTAKK
jgi:hypothetical protein